MINFEKHIREVLYEYDFVVIPNLGAFIANFEVIENNGIGTPSKTFSFNSLLNSDENHKFFNYLVRSESKPLAEIELQWNNYLLNLKNELNKNNRYEINGLGSLLSENDDTLNFLFPEGSNFYERDEFESDIEPISIVGTGSSEEDEELSNQVPNEIITAAPIVSPPVSSAIVQELDDNVEEIYEYEEAEEESGIKKYLLWLIPLFLLFAAAYYYWNFIRVNNEVVSATEQSSEINSSSIDSLESVDSDSLLASSAEGEVEAESIEESIETNDTNSSLSNNQSNNSIAKYHVWAGLFRSKSNADKLLNKLKRNGLDAKIQLVKNMRRVYVPVSTDKEAKEMVKKVEQLTGEKAVYFEVD